MQTSRELRFAATRPLYETQTLSAEVENPHVAGHTTVCKGQLSAIPRGLDVFDEEARFRKMGHALRRRGSPVLRRPGHPGQVLVIRLEIQPAAGWRKRWVVVFGRRRYDTSDTSRNSLLIALLTGGEGWHNNHHHYQASARQGFFWWEIDPTYYGLKVMSWFGIVKDLKAPPARVLRPDQPEPERELQAA